MELKGSKTEKNLQAAFAGESQARNKYTYFASAAKKEGYEQIATIFEETANNEREHAKIWFKLLNGIGNTAENLKGAADGEKYEWVSMYKEFEDMARSEGFNDIANLFNLVGSIEKVHEERYLALIKNLKEGKIFAKDSENVWVCRNCGHVHTGKDAPEVCPACNHPKAYFELQAKNY